MPLRLHLSGVGANGAYGCLGQNDSLVACGGEREHAKTCDVTPPAGRLSM